MAYRSNRGTRRSYSRATTRSRTRASGYRKSAGRSGRSARSSGRAQTVRIELVGMPANPVSRAIPTALKPVAPKKSKF